MNLEFKNLKFHHPGGEGDVFENLAGSIEGAGFHALFGPSGVGKTTLAGIISGRITGYAGQLETRGISKILYSYNLERLPGWCTVEAHFDDVRSDIGRMVMDELIDTFRLKECMTSRFNRLSLGQQNRVNLVRYLLQDFDLLIMDESLANVDETTKTEIILKIKHLFPNRCFIYISHNVVEVARFCRQILILRHASSHPQMVSVMGGNDTGNGPAGQEDLEKTMLEIMHAV